MKEIRLLSAALLGCAGVLAAQNPVPADVTREASTPAESAKRWFLELVPNAGAVAAGENAFEDTLQFEAAKRVSFSACRAKGFDASSFELTKLGEDAWKLTTDQSSEDHGETAWRIELRNGRVSGSMTWARPPESDEEDEKRLVYSVAGRCESALEGLRYETVITPDAAADLEKDEAAPLQVRATLAIERGRLVVDPKFLGGYAGGWVDVTETDSGRAITITQTAPNRATREWSATINGRVIEGAIVDKVSGKVRQRYTFEGKQAPPPRG